MTQGGDAAQLVAEVLSGNFDEHVCSRLLKEFQGGVPVSELLPLLADETDDTAAGVGAWVASELGRRIAPIAHHLPKLLSRTDARVRFNIVEAILDLPTADSKVVARALERLVDSDFRVRWKTMSMLVRRETQGIREALEHVADARLRGLLVWLMDRNATCEDVVARLSDKDATVRRIAAIRAAQLLAVDPNPLRVALKSKDRDVELLARFEFKMSDGQS